MLTCEEVKHYLRIPFDDDNEEIDQIIDAGYTYLKTAVDDFDEIYSTNQDFMKTADIWVKTQWAPTMYDQREGATANAGDLNFVARSMITQLQTYKKGVNV